MFRSADIWQPVPEWGQFLLELGRRFARFHSAQGELVVALTLPTRAYAAALAATGVVLERAAKSSGNSDALLHFQQLTDLVKLQGPTPVYLKEGENKHITGQLTSVRNGHLVVLTGGEHNGWLTHYVPRARSLGVQLADHAKRLGRAYKILNSGFEFLDRCLPGLNPVDFASETLFDCAIIGVRDHLRAEMTETTFRLQGTPSRPVEGCLQDILRVRDFLPPGANYRSKVLSPMLQPITTNLQPLVAIFDGGRGFLRYRDAWGSVPWLVLLDRTESSFDEAASAINSDHLYRSNDAEDLNLPPIPPAIEVMTFERPR
jgi:hypothetical protein